MKKLKALSKNLFDKYFGFNTPKLIQAESVLIHKYLVITFQDNLQANSFALWHFVHQNI